MAFGQQSGPPATAKQVQELLSLLHEAGHADFRDARGPMGFTQRQAGGKFSRDEAAAFIEQLQHEAEHSSPQPAAGADAPPASPASRPSAQPKSRPSAAEQALAKVSTPQLAAELQRRGWIVVEP
ncbi:MAG TPA: hypothetical protein PLQ10_00115 [Ilumatobacteraceae bacterium]|nr:hypothetical protein [Acidimicrobiaceae bacterium]HQY13076.1 hypothetical protein [Ilumatobacteraceae bacterium]HQY86274.1 hypothetical protein [Ilumatobacteraceae bacterium]HRA84685.1 hypothetical protein [Ilumatobacteraceae bacterium]